VHPVVGPAQTWRRTAGARPTPPTQQPS